MWFHKLEGNIMVAVFVFSALRGCLVGPAHLCISSADVFSSMGQNERVAKIAEDEPSIF